MSVASRLVCAEDGGAVKKTAFELLAKAGCNWTMAFIKDAVARTDVPTTLVGLIKQRRRWLNGSLFALAYALLAARCPIFGRRRVPYMALGAFAYAVALQFYARVDSIPALYAAGDADMDIISSLLSDGKDSRLYKTLVLDKQIAKDIEAYQYSARLHGQYMIEATPAEGHTTEDLLAEIDAILADNARFGAQ